MLHIRPGTKADVPRALAIWRAAVDATHGFLSTAHRAEIDTMVAEQFLPQAPLWLVEDDAGAVQAFLAMDGTMIDALFVDPAAHGRGLGSALIAHALSLSPDLLVDANEQADNALPFYLARGFEVIGRSESDPEGRPYPILHLRYVG
ncbi:putative acetyltransferase [Sphingomonas kyeonggiensis]|uniref:Putative acetyltransferase n=1 Tax=Sphingomonas kyeonggiensis TaxID=1268553 RepID=A0A7W7K6A3_9SPHN|nr:acetyltransferase [Sphingomonas kyeonggiensis]MBB4841165.1 putative acetyltransferase [Sphingomonas kyeonggiensis]